MFRWSWEGIDGVSIHIKPDGGQEQHYDLLQENSIVNNASYSIPHNAASVEVAISSIIRRVDNGVFVESEPVRKTFSLCKVLVDFVNIQKGGMFAKNKYTLVLRSGAQLPCSLALYANEGSYPTNLASLQPIVGVNNEVQFVYERRGKQDLYFRLAVCEEDKEDLVVISPDVKCLK